MFSDGKPGFDGFVFVAFLEAGDELLVRIFLILGLFRKKKFDDFGFPRDCGIHERRAARVALERIPDLGFVDEESFDVFKIAQRGGGEDVF